MHIAAVVEEFVTVVETQTEQKLVVEVALVVFVELVVVVVVLQVKRTVRCN